MSDKRNDKRLPVSISVRYFYGRMFYAGTALNISEHGMLIKSKECLPQDSEILIIIHEEKEILTVHGRVLYLNKNGDLYNGMGIKVMHSPVNYFNFVSRLRADH